LFQENWDIKGEMGQACPISPHSARFNFRSLPSWTNSNTTKN